MILKTHHKSLTKAAFWQLFWQKLTVGSMIYEIFCKRNNYVLCSSYLSVKLRCEPAIITNAKVELCLQLYLHVVFVPFSCILFLGYNTLVCKFWHSERSFAKISQLFSWAWRLLALMIKLYARYFFYIFTCCTINHHNTLYSKQNLMNLNNWVR